MITIMLTICFLHLLIARSIITVFIIIIKHFFYHTKVSKKQTFKNLGESLGEKKPNSTMNSNFDEKDWCMAEYCMTALSKNITQN